MGENGPEKKPVVLGPFGTFGLISGSCALATVINSIVVASIVGRWSTFDAASLFAVATIVACPAFLGVGVSYFVAKTANFHPKGLDRLE